MSRFARLALIGLAFASAAFIPACATGENAPAYVVVEPNATINDRNFIRRIAVLDDDQLLIEETAGRYYLVKLFPGCLSFADIMSPVSIEETSIGIDRSTRFIVDGRTCPVRSIDRVERAERAPGDAAPAGTEQAPAGAGSDGAKEGGA